MPNEKLKTLNETDHDHDPDQEEINWLGGHPGEENGWETVKLKGDMSDPKQRQAKERVIKAYIRGWLELYNDENNRNHKVIRVEIRNNWGEDKRFTVKAFIDPPPSPPGNGSGPGAHLIPQEPPPPGDSF